MKMGTEYHIYFNRSVSVSDIPLSHGSIDPIFFDGPASDHDLDKDGETSDGGAELPILGLAISSLSLFLQLYSHLYKSDEPYIDHVSVNGVEISLNGEDSEFLDPFGVDDSIGKMISNVVYSYRCPSTKEDELSECKNCGKMGYISSNELDICLHCGFKPRPSTILESQCTECGSKQLYPQEGGLICRTCGCYQY